MYRNYYKLTADPFRLDPDLDFLYLSKAHEEAVSHIAYGLQQEETVILISGDIGTGKTLALHRVLDQLSSIFAPVVVSITTVDFIQFLRLVLLKMGEESPPSAMADLLNIFEKRLVELRSSGRKLLLIVDEAQNCGAPFLESIRLLLNLAQPGKQVLQLVLVGQIGLDETLALPELRQFKQRIRVSYRLESLNRAEVGEYIVHRLRVAGREEILFESGALDRVFALSGGIPRLVNQFASRALLAGYVEDARSIKAAHVEAEALDPAPPPPGSDLEGIVQFADQVSLPSRGPDRHTSIQAGASAARRRHGFAWRPIFAVALFLIAATVGIAMRGQWWPVLKRTMPSTAESRIAAVPPPSVSAEESLVVELSGRDTSETAGVTEAATVPAVTSLANSDSVPLLEGSLLHAPSGTSTSEGAATRTDTLVAKSVIRSANATTNHVDDDRPVSVHVFSFATPDRAENSRNRMIQLGVPSFVKKEPGSSDRWWYRVYIGPFPARHAAEATVDSLRQVGAIEYFAYTHKSPDNS